MTEFFYILNLLTKSTSFRPNHRPRIRRRRKIPRRHRLLSPFQQKVHRGRPALGPFVQDFPLDPLGLRGIGTVEITGGLAEAA